MDIYLKVPFAKGDVTADKFSEWIAIQSMNFQISKSVSMEIGNLDNYTRALPDFGQVNITKLLNEATTEFFNHIAHCTAPFEVEIVLVDGSPPLEYARFVLEGANVTNFEFAVGSGGEPSEAASFSYKALKVQFTPRRADDSEDSKLTARADLAKIFRSNR
ncbi:MAG: type VI protein secretion system component Hcp [Halieaceae bacterium]